MPAGELACSSGYFLVHFVGEEQQFRRHVLLLQHREELHALAGDIAEILLAVDYERGVLKSLAYVEGPKSS